MADAVYAQQLAKLKHGLPLWVPEPTWRERPVAVGDVGYVKRGAFYPLFNACLPASEQSEMGVPEGFIPLALTENDVCVMDKYFDAGPLYTTSVTKIETCAEVSATLAQAEAGIQFHCSNKVGAVLVLKQPATRHDALPCQRLADYIRRHHASWLDFANERHQRGIQTSDLILVSGYDLTSEWALAAFTEASRGAGIFFRGGYSALAGGGLSLSGTWDTVMSAQHRSGPPKAQSPRPSSILSTITTWKSAVNHAHQKDQCVFLRGYKIRPRRLLAPKVMEAAAEPKDDEAYHDEPPPSPLLEDSNSDYEVESLAESAQTHDPLDLLLDYILDVSNAQNAVACHNDLLAICKASDSEIPDDLVSYLKSLSPSVVVDNDGVGFINLPLGLSASTKDHQPELTEPKAHHLNWQEDHAAKTASPEPEEEDINDPLFVRARYNHHPNNPEELAFEENDVIEVLSREESGWWDGLLGGERGWFPSNMVDIMLNMTEAASYSAERAVAAASPPLYISDPIDVKKATPPASPESLGEASLRSRTASDSWWDGSKLYTNTQARERAQRAIQQARSSTSGIFSRWTSSPAQMDNQSETETSMIPAQDTPEGS